MKRCRIKWYDGRLWYCGDNYRIIKIFIILFYICIGFIILYLGLELMLENTVTGF